MIKCDQCGNKISLEELRCPNCNQLNRIAEEHYHELAAYDIKYKNALKSVYRQTAEYRGYIWRILITGILIFICFFAFAFSKSADDMMEDLFHPKNDAYIAAHSANKDSYLTAKQYEAYAALCQTEGYLTRPNDHKVMDSAVKDYVAILDVLLKMQAQHGYKSETLLTAYADTISSSIFYFKQEEQILMIYKEANKNGVSVNPQNIDAIRAAFSDMPMPSDSSLTLQIESLASLKLRIIELLSYELNISVEEATQLWDMDRSTARLTIEQQIKEVYPND